jgi:hypothetical protein
MKPTQNPSTTSGTSPTIPPEDLIPIEELAKRLHQTVGWVREKCRRRCPNPIPVWNLGRHLLFDWNQVSAWIRSCPRPVHASHRRRAGKLAGRGIHIAKVAA